MQEELRIEKLNENEWDQWDEWLSRIKHSSPFSNSWWFKTVCNVFGGIPNIVVVKNHKDEILGGIGYREIDVMGRRLIRSSNLSLYMPVVFSVGLSRRELSQAEKQLGSFIRKEYDVVTLTNTKELSDVRGFQWVNFDTEVRYTATLYLNNFSLDIVDRAEKKQIKKAEREDLVTEMSSDIDIMYNLWVKTFERQGLLPPVSFYQLKELYDTLEMHNAVQGFITFDKVKNPASFRVCVWNNSYLVYDWIAGSDPNYFKYGAPALNVYSSLLKLKEDGFQEFDFCGANIESIADFKLSFGAKLTPYYVLNKTLLWFEVANQVRKTLKSSLNRLLKNKPRNKVVKGGFS